MVQGVRQALERHRRPQIVSTPRDSRLVIKLLRSYLGYRDRSAAAADFQWRELGSDTVVTDRDRILIVTELDLHDYLASGDPVPWLDINVIVVETYWQLNFYRSLIDLGRRYILIMDTWMSHQDYQESFAWLPTLDRFYIKFDVYEILRIMSTGAPEWNVCPVPLRSKPFATFALIGRGDIYRDRFVHRMAGLQLPHTLVKYRGEIRYNTARNFDSRPYDRGEFFEDGGYQCTTGSFDIMPDFYRQYRFETVVETTQWHDGGWPFREYNISEKTFKPIMTGVPAVILATQGYHAWLAEQLGIDVSGGLFRHTADLEPNDWVRLRETLTLVSDLASGLDQEPDAAVIQRNQQAIMHIVGANTREIRRCVKLLMNL